MSFDTSRVRTHLNNFNFRELFIEELGWSRPTERHKTTLEVNGESFERQAVAELSGVVVYEVTSTDGVIPDAKTRRAIHGEISKLHYENLLIFLDRERTQSLWYWAKREGKKTYPRDHTFMHGQPADLFLQKLSGMVVDISELDEEGNIAVTEVASKLKGALDVERVTKKFYTEFREEHLAFIEYIKGIDSEHDRRWYASVLLNRLMFIYFLQSKGFIKGHEARQAFRYLQDEFKRSGERGKDRYYSEFLDALFFEGFAKPESNRSTEAWALVGSVPYLNGGLFLKHGIEERWPSIAVPDVAFENLFALFERYSWNLDDTPGGQADEINPDVLGYIFEKYINQKAFGAYYTRTEITQYLCEQTIYKLILDRINAYVLPPPATPHTGELFTVKDHNLFASRRFDSMAELLLNLDAFYCQKLLHDILPDLKLLDPACGSGAFLVAAMKTLTNIYAAVIGKIEFLGDAGLKQWLGKLRREHPSINYYIKKRIITDNLFGVDIMEEATEIAKLRLFLALVASVERAEQLEPLPNIDFNILTGHSLIGLLRVDDQQFDRRHAQGNLFQKAYRDFVRETTNEIRAYRRASSYEQDLHALRADIEQKKLEVTATLDDILLDQFQDLGVKFEQATWDEKKNKEGKPVKRKLTPDDIRGLRPFHWGFEFDDTMSKGGFDAIITNPPWEIFKPIAKEFCYDVDPSVERRGTNIKDFEKKLAELLKKRDVREKYLQYSSQFPHLSAYFRSVRQYENQIAVVNGKKAGTDINLYKLFLEQCFNLLKEGGECGIVLPSGIYSDLGTKQLREMLFGGSQITGLFCFENRNAIFEGVHRSFKFVVLTFKKGGVTEEFPAAFMRHEVKDLERFPSNDGLRVNVNLIRSLSPDSLSVIEFQNPIDIHIARKMAKFPLLGKHIESNWNLALTRELDMTNDSNLFEQRSAKGRLPLYEGKMIWHFTHGLGEPRYWVDEKKAITKLLSPRVKAIKKLLAEADLDEDFDESKIELGYRHYRLGFRAVTGATNERALVVSIIPKNVFAGNSLILSIPFSDKIIENEWMQERMYSSKELFACTALMASVVCDWFIRKKILTNMNMFYVYEIPVPRLTEQDPKFAHIVERAAKLICTTPEFDDLAREVSLKDHTEGATDEQERAQLRAELDGMIGHLYDLTEDEFDYILSTFPLVSDEVKAAALDQFRRFAPIPDDHTLVENIKKGETDWQELKVAACWNPFTKKKDDSMRANIVQAVASFLNSREGGALVIGVDAKSNVVGLEDDYAAADPKQPNRDGYERFIRNLLNATLGAEHSALYRFTFGHVAGREICHIKIEPSPKPVFYNGDMYIRDGNGKRKLTAQATLAYQKQRWRR